MSRDLNLMSFGRDNLTIYNEKMFHILAKRDKTPMGVALNKFRLNLTRRYSNGGKLLDIGVGAATFVRLHGDCLGFDINPYAINMLKKWGLWFDPYKDSFRAARIGGVTFFDSFEHIENPLRILNRLTSQFVFISIPIFRDKRHMLASKHFKPGEHVWHFTRRQFIEYVGGFKIIEELNDETDIGREDIKTFVMRRKHA
jgi:hypothetical protein